MSSCTRHPFVIQRSQGFCVRLRHQDRSNHPNYTPLLWYHHLPSTMLCHVRFVHPPSGKVQSHSSALPMCLPECCTYFGAIPSWRELWIWLGTSNPNLYYVARTFWCAVDKSFSRLSFDFEQNGAGFPSCNQNHIFLINRNRNAKSAHDLPLKGMYFWQLEVASRMNQKNPGHPLSNTFWEVLDSPMLRVESGAKSRIPASWMKTIRTPVGVSSSLQQLAE